RQSLLNFRTCSRSNPRPKPNDQNENSTATIMATIGLPMKSIHCRTVLSFDHTTSATVVRTINQMGKRMVNTASPKLGALLFSPFVLRAAARPLVLPTGEPRAVHVLNTGSAMTAFANTTTSEYKIPLPTSTCASSPWKSPTAAMGLGCRGTNPCSTETPST